MFPKLQMSSLAASMSQQLSSKPAYVPRLQALLFCLRLFFSVMLLSIRVQNLVSDLSFSIELLMALLLIICYNAMHVLVFSLPDRE